MTARETSTADWSTARPPGPGSSRTWSRSLRSTTLTAWTWTGSTPAAGRWAITSGIGSNDFVKLLPNQKYRHSQCSLCSNTSINPPLFWQNGLIQLWKLNKTVIQLSNITFTNCNCNNLLFQTECKEENYKDKDAFTAWVKELSAAFKPKGI